jgi:outer membrane protein OmpA-like peptidoglycan-associated protein
MTPMRHPLALLAVAAALGCAGRGAKPGGSISTGDAPVLRAAELARVRCLLLAPLDNASDAPNAADVATSTLVEELMPSRARAFPVSDLRALFRDTPLELPAGVAPSLALELAELVGADAALYGSIEGRALGAGPELLVTLRLSLAGDHRLLFAQEVVVTPAADERTDSAVRRAVIAAARPVLMRLGDASASQCFDPERAKALRKVALAEAAAPSRVAPAAPPAPSAPAIAAPSAPAALVPAAAPQVASVPRTPRQAEWARRLGEGGRFVVEDVAFTGRSGDLQRDAGLADLAAALLSRPEVSVRVEGFVDATNDRAADHRISVAMVNAAAERLAALGVPRQRVTSRGRGGDDPRLPNFTTRGRAANRRIEVVGVR